MSIVFYIASIIAIFASIKVISCLRVDKAILYLVISFFASALIFILLNTYFSAVLYLILFLGATVTLFLFVSTIIGIRVDNVETSKRGISPKIWLGPLILAFILLVMLIYGVVSSDYAELKNTHDNTHEMSLYAYILMAELACFLLLGAVIIAYHFMNRLLSEK
ncbi:hypothetical protein A9G11_08080 [Gilliamella sp. wkB108]|uniref:NADH-quinone oxidoreductase subunit J n=1 Tax=Gilliamella sp. wkB108 TaxID=3120256 RepID=UPI00080DD803|nr:NADH-quinone oxidoreductase subunit J [Gilliamella apicola]OCG21620.1 hypothetical protein A9G11_08080 [Gilliamella apicola]